MGKTCGSCKFFEKTHNYHWGKCYGPMPDWCRETGPIIFPNDKMAQDCEVFAPIDSKPRKG